MQRLGLLIACTTVLSGCAVLDAVTGIKRDFTVEDAKEYPNIKSALADNFGYQRKVYYNDYDPAYLAAPHTISNSFCTSQGGELSLYRHLPSSRSGVQKDYTGIFSCQDTSNSFEKWQVRIAPSNTQWTCSGQCSWETILTVTVKDHTEALAQRNRDELEAHYAAVGRNDFFERSKQYKPVGTTVCSANNKIGIVKEAPTSSDKIKVTIVKQTIYNYPAYSLFTHKSSNVSMVHMTPYPELWSDSTDWAKCDYNFK